MGGQPDLDLSSHKRDDSQYEAKRNYLLQYLPHLEEYLEVQRKHGKDCGQYTVLCNLQRILCSNIRVPIHILLSGEDLLKREVLNHNRQNDSAVTALWRSSGFRNAVRLKLDDALQNLLRLSTKVCDDDKADDLDGDLAIFKQQSPERMEATIYVQSNTKDDYLESAARVLIHLHHLAVKLKARGSLTKGERSIIKRKRRSDAIADAKRRRL